jgi:uncharacterized protein DUF1320
VTSYSTPVSVRNALRVPDSAPADVVRIPVDDIQDEQIQPHCDQADSIAVTYCSGSNAGAAFIATQATDIAAYRLVLAWRGSADFITQTDPVWLRYQMAMSMLEDVAKGLITPEPDPDDGSDIQAVNIAPDTRLTTVNAFGRGILVDQPFGYPDNTYPYGYGGYGYW